MFSKSFPLVKTILLTAICCLTGCEQKTEVKNYHLTKKTVYMIRDTSGEAPPPVVLADTSYLEHVFRGYNLANISELDSTIQIKLRYADTNNFLGRNFYDGLRHAYFTCDLAIRICNAQYFLKEIDSSLSLVILDAARPLHIQQMMWDSLDMHPDKKYSYLSPPYETSMHNYACAADLSIINAKGELLDMGTDYDYFHKMSQPVYEKVFIKSGELSAEAVYHRKMLRYVMQRAGLKGINSEWWHFALCTKPEAAARYQLIR